MVDISAQLRRARRIVGGALRDNLPDQMGGTSLRARASSSAYPIRRYDDEEAARRAIGLIDTHTMLSYERLVTLWQQVRHLNDARIEGALVECGTWRGGAAGLMALAELASGEARRPIHLFDSFEGLPEPDASSDGNAAIDYAGGKAAGTLDSIGQCVGSLEDNQELMARVGYPSDLTRYHVGWFQQTVPESVDTIGDIALLRLDGDWYESTKICLDYLFPKVVHGGIVVIDDYGHWPGCRKAVDEYMATLERPILLNHIDASGRYLIVP